MPLCVIHHLVNSSFISLQITHLEAVTICLMFEVFSWNCNSRSVLLANIYIITVNTNNTGQQNLTFFMAHKGKYLILIELLTLNSNM